MLLPSKLRMPGDELHGREADNHLSSLLYVADIANSGACFVTRLYKAVLSVKKAVVRQYPMTSNTNRFTTDRHDQCITSLHLMSESHEWSMVNICEPKNVAHSTSSGLLPAVRHHAS